MSALNLGQLNIRPETDHELYRNGTDEALNVSIALTDLQTAFTLKYDSKEATVSASGVITVTVPGGKLLTLSHGEKNIMQPVKVQISVA